MERRRILSQEPLVANTDTRVKISLPPLVNLAGSELDYSSLLSVHV